ncbi:MAG: hypothetical protein MZW92_38860 [Comamonadaceae bacterium]|nr:hypothetical protein [Comamonadaceae bacterium]
MKIRGLSTLRPCAARACDADTASSRSVAWSPRRRQRRQPARGGVRRQRRTGVQCQPDHGRGRRHRRTRTRPHRRRRRPAGRRARRWRPVSTCSMRSQRELYEYQIGLEREELDQYPRGGGGGAGAHLRVRRGMPHDEARAVATQAAARPGARARHAGSRGAGPEPG